MQQNLVDQINNANDQSQLQYPILLACLKRPQLVKTQKTTSTQVLYRVFLYDPAFPTPSTQAALAVVIPKDRFPSMVNDPETIEEGTIFNIVKFTFKVQAGKAKVVIVHTFTLSSDNKPHTTTTSTNNSSSNNNTATSTNNVSNVQRSNPPPPQQQQHQHQQQTNHPSTTSSGTKPPAFSSSVNNNNNSAANTMNPQVNRNNNQQAPPPSGATTFNRPPQSSSNHPPQHNNNNNNNQAVPQRSPQQQQPANTFNRPPSSGNSGHAQQQPRPSVGGGGGSGPTSLKSKQPLPLIGITPWVSDWVIKVRVTKKGELKNWANTTKQGCLFSLDLIDEDGVEIRATFFNDKFYGQINESKVYYMKGGKAKNADKRYSRLPHTYELTFYDNSIIEEADDDQGKIPQGHFDFTPFEQLKTITKKNGVDIVGVVRLIGNPESMTIKPKQDDPNGVEKQTTKRELVLINKDNDGTVYEAAITLWGDYDNLPFNIGDTVIFTALTIKEFKGGLKLSTSKSTKILPNFDIPESRKVMEQFANSETPIEEIKGIQLSAVTESSKGSFKKYALEDLDTVRVQELEQEKFKSKTFFIRSHFLLFKSDSITYCACVNENCKSKKLKREDDLESGGSFKCPSCGMVYDESSAAHKYLTSVVLGDHTAAKTLTAFDKGIEALLGRNAATFASEDENDKNELRASVQFKAATYMIRAGIQHNDQQGSQVRLSLVGLKEPEWDKEAKGCLSTINSYCRTFGI